MSAALDLTRPPSHSRRQQDVGAAYDRPHAPRSRIPGWIVVHSYPQAERWAQAQLNQRGYETFLPLVTVQRRDRVIRSLQHRLEVPLFARYLFVRFPGNWTPIRYCPGVYRIVFAGAEPSLCPNDALEAVRSALQARETLAATEPAWKPGTPCSLLYGPLRGMPAIVTKVRTSTANITIMMLGQLRRVTVDLDCLRARDD